MRDFSKYSRNDLIDIIEGLEEELDQAVEILYKHNKEWVRLNFPTIYKKLESND